MRSGEQLAVAASRCGGQGRREMSSPAVTTEERWWRRQRRGRRAATTAGERRVTTLRCRRTPRWASPAPHSAAVIAAATAVVHGTLGCPDGGWGAEVRTAGHGPTQVGALFGALFVPQALEPLIKSVRSSSREGDAVAQPGASLAVCRCARCGKCCRPSGRSKSSSAAWRPLCAFS